MEFPSLDPELAQSSPEGAGYLGYPQEKQVAQQLEGQPYRSPSSGYVG